MKARKYELLAAVLLAATALADARPCQALAVGGHVGVNLDNGEDVHIGFDLMVPLMQVAPRFDLSLWPNVAHVFVYKGHDAELLNVDLPFRFELTPVFSLFVGPGMGLAIHGEVTPKFNIVQGLFIQAGPVRPFAELALRFIRGTYADLLVGVLFEL